LAWANEVSSLHCQQAHKAACIPPAHIISSEHPLSQFQPCWNSAMVRKTSRARAGIEICSLLFMALANISAEVRTWFLICGSQRERLKLGPFVDSGKITDLSSALRSKGWLWDTGVQLKVRMFGSAWEFRMARTCAPATTQSTRPWAAEQISAFGAIIFVP
jgi:hypothetical protein